MRIVAAGFVSLLALACAGGGEKRPEDPFAGLENHDPAVRYVGADACRKCHQEIAATYARTGMGRSAYPMTAEVAVEDFTERNEFHDERSGLRYRMTARDGAYWMHQSLRDANGRESLVDERRIDWVIGSNHHSRSYVTIEDGAWYQMPVCWYPEPEMWDLCPGYEKKNQAFRRKISASCVYCHNGRMVALSAEENRYEAPVPHGIGCERCHGPGELHVARWERGDEAPTGTPDPTIFNPRRLPAPERSEVCYQCHLGDSEATERANRYDRKREAFRPGRPATEAFVAIHYVVPSEHGFGLSAQADRLMRSACFVRSRGAIDCLTCHDPHVTVYRADRPDDFFNSKCARCHASDACAAPAAARAGTSPVDDCVACHMRKAEAQDQAHASFTDHWIRRSIETDPGERRTSLDVLPALPREFRAFDPAERAYYVARGMIGLAGDWPAGSERDALMAAAESSARKAQEAGLRHAEAATLLGRILVERGKPGEAAAAFADAVALDPGHAEAAWMLGRSLGEAGRGEEAAARLHEAAARHPDDPRILEELVVHALAAGRTEEALAACDRTLAKDPAAARVRANRGIALWKLGRYAEALDEMRRAAASDPSDPAIWRFLAGSLREAGLREEAVEAAERVRLLRAAPAAAHGTMMGDD